MSLQEISNDTRIVCDLCGTTTDWGNMIAWWVGVDQACDDLYLCPTCQDVAYYCDICQSIHRQDEVKTDCNIRQCPQCESFFPAHPGYAGVCPKCIYASYGVAAPPEVGVPATSRETCA